MDALRRWWLIIKISDSASLTWTKRNKKETTQTVRVCVCVFPRYMNRDVRKLSPWVVFLWVQDKAGADACPHGIEWQHTHTLLLLWLRHDEMGTMSTVMPFWVSQSRSQSPWFYSSLIWAFDSQRGEFIGGKRQVCLYVWLCHESSSDGTDPSSPFRLHKLHLLRRKKEKKTVVDPVMQEQHSDFYCVSNPWIHQLTCSNKADRKMVCEAWIAK